MNTLTDEEIADIQKVGENLPHAQLSDWLIDLYDREKIILEQSDMGEGEARKVTIHNMTVLLAAAARIKDLTKIP